MYKIREGHEEDRDAVVEMLKVALGELDTFDESWIDGWSNYWNRPENEDWAFVASHEGQIVANLSFFKNNGLNNIRGNPMCFGGVWAVATKSEHRRKGLLTSIYNNVFPIMKDRGMVLSILDPSPYYGAQLAYEKNGYAIAERRMKHVFPPVSLKQTEVLGETSIRELTDVDDHSIISKLEYSMCRFGSRVFTWPMMFSREIQSGDFFILETNSEPVGCIKFSLKETDEGRTLSVSRTYFTSGDLIPSIINTIVQNASDATRIEWTCEPEIPVRDYVSNIHELKTTHTGTMMMRVVDFEGYCNVIKVSGDVEEELILKVNDPQCPWNEAVYRLSVINGKLEIERIDEESKVEVTLDALMLAKVTCGITPKITLQDTGMISCSSETARKLDEMFPVDSFFSYIRF